MIFLDCETNLAHDKIWLVCTRKDGEAVTWYEPHGLQKYLKGQTVCGHNVIGFDLPVLEKVWGIKADKIADTLVMSRLLNPVIDNGHSLKAWGKRLGFDKMDFDVEDFDSGLTDDMEEYCARDVEVTEKLYHHLTNEFKKWKEGGKQAIDLEHKVALIMAQQERNGFKLDIRSATDMLTEFKQEMYDITEELQQVFPPIVEERWSEKTGKRLKDKVTVFNVGSRKQIAERLEGLGVKFKKFTDKGNTIVDETTLADIDLHEAKLISRYLMLQKRVGLLESWLDSVKDDERVHGRVITNGAITGRMTHQKPNMGQIPSVKSEYGPECRSLWTVDQGNVLVGCDLSGIELRCLAHYMRDDDYTKELLEGDIHTANQKAAGLDTRDQAKTFIYAMLYGAGPAKIGKIAGGGYDKGKQLTDKFLSNFPKLRRLVDKVQRLAVKGYLPGLDGRQVIVRSEHAALNTLLQSCGAIIAKQWIVECHKLFDKYGINVKQVAMVHDEIQVECAEADADKVANIMVAAAALAGDSLNFRVPVDAEAKIGNTWYDTH